ncbi:alpha-L-fucosidase [Sphingobacterium sp. MYb382]|uniref:alpha-L-fucosidase n=1 Tax=Sphingobacterium sp. MYb382 TaxID=2745278 RepID=UPI00309E25BD
MKSLKLFLIICVLPLFLLGQTPPAPYGAIPSERQLKWHELEMYCLIHFTPTTFQNKEWGYGDADPKLFNPQKFDAGQIAAAAASAGFKGLISVAKHHDGFCLWPTATTDYSIAHSPWREGKGDMVKEFMEASHEHGLQFGVYLYAWDRNDMRYGTPAYAEAYRAQLTELMTNYGPLFTSWHDGANGGDGYYGGLKEKRTIDRTTYYEWYEKTWPIVRRYQPMAMIFSDVGPDMRWVGNEKGMAAETSWATLTPRRTDGLKPVPGVVDETNLPTGDRDGAYWIPAECDVPHRKGWFFHPEEDLQVKTPNQLFDIYLKSVGRGANLNLGLAPMPDGYLHPNDVQSLKAFGRKVDETFKVNLAKGAKMEASNVRGESVTYAAEQVLDDDRSTYYAADDDVLNTILTVRLPQPTSFDLIRLREYIPLGQRLDSVTIEIWKNGEWQFLAKATSIGANRLIRLDALVTADALRIHLYAPVAPTLSDFGLFRIFEEDFAFAIQGPIFKPLLLSKDYLLQTEGAEAAVDGDLTSFAHLVSKKKGLDFKLHKPISAIGYLPRQDGHLDGTVLKYSLYNSADGKVWTLFQEGEFSNIQANPIQQYIRFGESKAFNYLRFVPKETISDGFTVAEFSFFE